MGMSNAERQRRYIERPKARAEGTQAKEHIHTINPARNGETIMVEANQSLNDRRTARDQQHNMEPERLAQVSTAAFASILELQAQLLRTWSDGLMVWAQSIDANMRTHRDRAT